MHECRLLMLASIQEHYLSLLTVSFVHSDPSEWYIPLVDLDLATEGFSILMGHPVCLICTSALLLGDCPEELGLALGLQLGLLRLDDDGALLQELGVRLRGQVVHHLRYILIATAFLMYKFTDFTGQQRSL